MLITLLMLCKSNDDKKTIILSIGYFACVQQNASKAQLMSKYIQIESKCSEICECFTVENFLFIELFMAFQKQGRFNYLSKIEATLLNIPFLVLTLI